MPAYLPEDLDEQLTIIAKRVARFTRDFGSALCPECRETLSFDAPWAQCTGCGWTEGY